MPRIYKRKFDWDDAKRRRDAGETIASIAAELGVTYNAVWRVVKPGEVAREAEYRREWDKLGRCDDCGGAMSNSSRSQGRTRCWGCATAARVKRDENGNLYCPRCDEWKPQHAFYKDINRTARGKASECRSCSNARRREWRENNRERQRAYDRERKRQLRSKAA